ncbi:glucose inhibited division protein A subfamily protein [Cardiosporidium cionae]|uniref:Glucose inhibited division protein A subfamily protein n=1 Tax=Cardiosporidium cionae TaxID=476202 RepID=A0ABQ7J8B2_9APIC|nr:glucose inhibited division protein A subfamily protein [Cardiosporidium cionae]|eukprot:KAF8820226.1 glucose inhibited division protein A subfamily protein [Cardiosporidium cionae]
MHERIIHSIEGLEQCEILRPGYDVEYDFVDPRCLYPTLETRQIEGLFFAGQICGTTGYEEAAAMGIVAGINAALNRESTPRDESLKNLPSSFIVHRDEAYMGVLIDDLVTKGTNEPYRMFTSRAEHRLTLRNDNADIRLTRRGHVLGVVSPQRYSALEQREKKIQWSLERLRKFKLPLYKWVQCGLLNSTDFERSLQHTRQRSAAEILFMPNISLFILEKCVEDVAKTEEKGCDEKQIFNFTEPHVAETVEAECKYSKYIQRQKRELQRWQKSMHLLIPSDINYSREIFPSFSAEALQKLAAQRPRSISEAARISGINSQSLFDLYSYIAKTNS